MDQSWFVCSLIPQNINVAIANILLDQSTPYDFQKSIYKNR